MAQQNHHSFLRQWLAKFRAVSKHHFQGYLNFLGLLLNDDADWFSKTLSYESSGERTHINRPDDG